MKYYKVIDKSGLGFLEWTNNFPATKHEINREVKKSLSRYRDSIPNYLFHYVLDYDKTGDIENIYKAYSIELVEVKSE